MPAAPFLQSEPQQNGRWKGSEKSGRKARIVTLSRGGTTKSEKLKGQIPVGSSHDPLAALEFRLLDFIRWLGVLGTLIFWVVTIWFFIAARGWVLVGFMVASFVSYGKSQLDG